MIIEYVREEIPLLTIRASSIHLVRCEALREPLSQGESCRVTQVAFVDIDIFVRNIIYLHETHWSSF